MALKFQVFLVCPTEGFDEKHLNGKFPFSEDSLFVQCLKIENSSTELLFGSLGLLPCFSAYRKVIHFFSNFADIFTNFIILEIIHFTFLLSVLRISCTGEAELTVVRRSEGFPISRVSLSSKFP